MKGRYFPAMEIVFLEAVVYQHQNFNKDGQTIYLHQNNWQSSYQFCKSSAYV